jgi:4-amino-4-deoxy-L-arabinose transferase-like glycosyltransferase
MIDAGQPVFVRWAGRIGLVLALMAGTVIGTRSITSEDAVSLQGDMPRYLMNGVFLYDALLSAPWMPDPLFDYAQRYYARYPALSLGHHPPLVAVGLVPFYAVFGVSILSARLAILSCFLAAIVFLFFLVRRYYDETVAGWACLLFASTPTIGSFSQQVLSEIPTVALTLLALLMLARFRASGRATDYLLFIVAAATSLFSRQTAVYMFPAYAVLLVMRGGIAQLTRRMPALITLGGCVAFAGAAIATLVFSPFNSDVVFDVMSRGVGWRTLVAVIEVIHRDHPTPWLLVAGGAALTLAIWRRDGRVLPAVIWILSVLGCAVAFTGTIEPARYSIAAMPALAVVGASIAAHRLSGLAQGAGALLLTAAVVGQLYAGRLIEPAGASGYEAAARFVLAQGGAPTVMYSASVDTGYFVFFVRKHDEARRLVVLRSDKVFTTSLMAALSHEDRISSPAEIEPLLKRYGTRFVVIEDHPTGSAVLDWLRDLTRTGPFVLRERFPTNSRDPRLAGVPVSVYEYLDAQPPAPDATLDMDLPLASRQIRVPLQVLIDQPAR